MSAIRHILGDLVSLHMRTDVTRLQAGLTVGDALEAVRKNPPIGRVVYFYVVGDVGQLIGVVPTRRLLLSSPDTPVTEIMVRRVVAIPHTATVLEACEFFTMHKLLAFPVVDDEKRVVGLVDVDMYTEEMSDLDKHEESEDLFQLIGVHLTEAEQKQPAIAFRRRFPWLLCNVAAGAMAAVLADAFEDVVTLVLVAPFIPLVLALAESVTIQSVSLALQSLHSKSPTWGEVVRKVGRELLVGLMLGVACGLLVGVLAVAWKGSVNTGLSLALGIGGGVTAAAAIGLAMPLMLKLLRRDPQVASGPIALAVSDMATLLLYFNLGRWLLV